MADIYIHVMFV